MPKSSYEESPLVDAAANLEGELQRYRKLIEEMSGSKITTEKTLVRATRAVTEAAACHETIMDRVGVLSEVMKETRTRQQTYAERMVEAARVVERRAIAFQALLARYEAIGEASGTVNARAADIAARKAAGADGSELRGGIDELLARMATIVNQAEDLVQSAKVSDFEDLARNVDSLKHQVQAALNRLTLVQRALAEQAPS